MELCRKKKVNDLWVELRGQSPSAEILTEARLVVAGVLADGGDLDGAISLLAGAGAGRRSAGRSMSRPMVGPR